MALEAITGSIKTLVWRFATVTTMNITPNWRVCQVRVFFPGQWAGTIVVRAQQEAEALPRIDDRYPFARIGRSQGHRVRIVHNRERHAEDGARGPTVDVDRSAVIGHDAVHDGKAQSGAVGLG
jgi:hypothetical protein